jgi:hypothetical protein
VNYLNHHQTRFLHYCIALKQNFESAPRGLLIVLPETKAKRNRFSYQKPTLSAFDWTSSLARWPLCSSATLPVLELAQHSL